MEGKSQGNLTNPRNNVVCHTFEICFSCTILSYIKIVDNIELLTSLLYLTGIGVYGRYTI